MSEEINKPTDLLGFMWWLSDFMGGFPSRERDGKATHSEIRRWIMNGSIEVNGERPREFGAQLEFPLKSLVLFPKGNRITLI